MAGLVDRNEPSRGRADRRPWDGRAPDAKDPTRGTPQGSPAVLPRWDAHQPGNPARIPKATRPKRGRHWHRDTLNPATPEERPILFAQTIRTVCPSNATPSHADSEEGTTTVCPSSRQNNSNYKSRHSEVAPLQHLGAGKGGHWPPFPEPRYCSTGPHGYKVPLGSQVPVPQGPRPGPPLGRGRTPRSRERGPQRHREATTICVCPCLHA